MYLLNNVPIFIAYDLVIGEGADAITHPAENLSSAEYRASLGIVDVPDQPRPDDRYHTVMPNGDGTYTSIPKDLNELRQQAVNEIKRLRQAALDTFPKSSGVSAIYNENVTASMAVKAGAGETTLVRTGATAAQYVADMAAGMGVAPAQFVDYVLAENATAARLAAEVETEYVRLVYVYVPACSFEQVQTVVNDYQVFCSARMQ